MIFFVFFSRCCFCISENSVQTIGLGGMKPNTVILGWPYGWRQSERDHTWKAFLETCRVCAASRMALVIPKGINFFPDSTEKVCNIWIFSSIYFYITINHSKF